MYNVSIEEAFQDYYECRDCQVPRRFTIAQKPLRIRCKLERNREKGIYFRASSGSFLLSLKLRQKKLLNAGTMQSMGHGEAWKKQLFKYKPLRRHFYYSLKKSDHLLVQTFTIKGTSWRGGRHPMLSSKLFRGVSRSWSS